VGAAREPEIVVVVPSYQRAYLLRRMVAALETQTLDCGRFATVIVDNGSTDQTSAVVTELSATSPLDLSLRRIETNQGPAQARNVGWRASSAPLVAFIDDDCVPEPGWLEAGLDALNANPATAVAQGMTLRPEGILLGDWTLYREIVEPTPYFEACNIFFRRDALEAAGGFDERIGWYGEDTALGWAVVSSGWERGFVKDAVVHHDVGERGLVWHMKTGFAQGNFVALAKRFPEFQREAFWRPWAFQRHEALFALAVVGALLTPKKRGAALLVIPWLRLRRPPPGHHRFWALLAERVAVDASVLAGMTAASLRARRFIL